MSDYSYEPIVLSEKCEDMKALHYLASMKFSEMEEHYKDSKHSKCSKEEKKKYFDYMKAWANEMIKNNGVVERTYEMASTANEDCVGRLYCGKGIQGKFYKIRGLTFNHTTDIDMKNAHPVILKYLCKIHDIKCPNLIEYVERRDEKLAEEMERLGKTRDEVKTMFLKATNKSTKSNKLVGFLGCYNRENRGIQENILKKPEYKVFVDNVPKEKTYNREGSALNRILCHYENRILQVIKKVVEEHGLEVAALMFDGLMVYGNHYENKELLTKIEEKIEENFPGLNMKMDYKEHDRSIVIPEDFKYNEQKPEKEMKDYESVKKRFEEEEKIYLIKDVASFVRYKNSKITFFKRNDLTVSFAYYKYEEKDKKGEIKQKSFIKKWVEDENIPRYETIGVYPPPLKTPSGVLNVWQPFAMELVEDYETKEEELEVIKNHILILCDNDKGVAAYFERWIGQMLKYPSVKTNCPTLISEEGAGKGTLIRLLSAMMGHEKVFETETPERDVWGGFNPRMANSFFVALNEVGRKSSRGAEGEIKALITDNRLTINPKGGNQYEINSYHRFIITTNNEEGAMKTHKNDRRNWIVRSSDEKCGDYEYFKKLSMMIEDVNVVKTCFEYFINLPNLNEFPYEKKPETQRHKEICEMQMDGIELFFMYKSQHKNDVIEPYFLKEIFDEFNRWKDECKITYDINYHRFYNNKTLKKYLINSGDKSRTNAVLWNVDWKKVREEFKQPLIIKDNYQGGYETE